MTETPAADPDHRADRGAELRPGGSRGASVVEYALLLSLVVLVCIAGVTLLGGATADQFSSVTDLFPE